MAVTRGHGNPKWARDEVILALDLYFDCKGNVPSSSDQRVIELSQLLRNIPYHATSARKESFRNPDGVAFKLQNLRQVDTGKGLGNISNMDREVWAEFGKSPERIKQLANLIRAGIKIAEGVKEEPGEYVVFSEGRVITEVHVKRERDPRVRKHLLEQRAKAGPFSCDLCSCSSGAESTEIAAAMFEAHHILPLAEAQERITSLKDLALLCANCHRMIHKAIAAKRQWLSIDEARTYIFGGENA